jgi:5'-deoxynucleotidase YfbR-like HD superfamily hydrolase
MERVLRMAILHDLAEAFTFDISKAYLTYLGKRGGKVKSVIETSAWQYLVRGMKPIQLSNNYLKLQQEYGEGRTVESKIVHAADSLDILLQAVDLRRRGYPRSCLKDLWNQSIKTIQASHIHSASTILRMIIRSSRELERS